MKKMRKVLVALVVLLLVLSPLTFAQEAEEPEVQEVEETETAEVVERDDLLIELVYPEVDLLEDKLQKYFDFNISKDFENEEVYLSTLVGIRKSWFDFTVGWNQPLEPNERGEATLSIHFWW